MKPDPYAEIKKLRDACQQVVNDLSALIPPQMILSLEEWANLPESVRNHLVSMDAVAVENPSR